MRKLKSLFFIVFFIIVEIIFILIDSFIQMGFYDVNDLLIENNLSDFYFLIMNQVIIPGLFFIIVALVLLLLINSVIYSLQDKYSETTLNTLNVITRLILIPGTIIAYLNTFTLFQGTLISVAALTGTAIGFASSNTIGNILSGLYLMLVRPFEIGDYIILPSQGREGVVIEISVNYTKILLPTGYYALFTNNSLLNQAVINTKIFRESKDSKGKKIIVKKYFYGQLWGLPVGDSHLNAQRAIEVTIDEFKTKVSEPISWFILNRDKFERQYQINLIVDEASILLDLTSEFLTSLARNYLKIKEKLIDY